MALTTATPNSPKHRAAVQRALTAAREKETGAVAQAAQDAAQKWLSAKSEKERTQLIPEVCRAKVEAFRLGCVSAFACLAVTDSEAAEHYAEEAESRPARNA